jgi:hypothetical protein
MHVLVAHATLELTVVFLDCSGAGSMIWTKAQFASTLHTIRLVHAWNGLTIGSIFKTNNTHPNLDIMIQIIKRWALDDCSFGEQWLMHLLLFLQLRRRRGGGSVGIMNLVASHYKTVIVLLLFIINIAILLKNGGSSCRKIGKIIVPWWRCPP